MLLCTWHIDNDIEVWARKNKDEIKINTPDDLDNFLMAWKQVRLSEDEKKFQDNLIVFTQTMETK